MIEKDAYQMLAETMAQIVNRNDALMCEVETLTAQLTAVTAERDAFALECAGNCEYALRQLVAMTAERDAARDLLTDAEHSGIWRSRAWRRSSTTGTASGAT